jgi:hypothetical protein
MDVDREALTPPVSLARLKKPRSTLMLDTGMIDEYGKRIFKGHELRI